MHVCIYDMKNHYLQILTDLHQKTNNILIQKNVIAAYSIQLRYKIKQENRQQSLYVYLYQDLLMYLFHSMIFPIRNTN